MKLLWHYTWDYRIGDILRSGYVDVARLGVSPNEKAIAWFSSNAIWENTVRKTRDVIGMEEMLARGIRLYRVGVLPAAAPLKWSAIRAQSGMSSKAANGLAALAAKWGASPWEWYGSFSPVPRSEWQAVEMFGENGWGKSANLELEQVRA